MRRSGRKGRRKGGSGSISPVVVGQATWGGSSGMRKMSINRMEMVAGKGDMGGCVDDPFI